MYDLKYFILSLRCLSGKLGFHLIIFLNYLIVNIQKINTQTL